MSDFSPIALISSQEIEEFLSSQGIHVLRLAVPTHIESVEVGLNTRLVVLDGQHLEDSLIFTLIPAILKKYLYLDILVFKPGAEASYVRTVLRAGATDVLYEDSLEKLTKAIITIQHKYDSSPQKLDFRDGQKKSNNFEGILSRNKAMWDIFQTIAHTANSDATVLIVGETGTGKDLLARAIHRQSERPGRFVAVNCSTISPEIIESELFGHERGAFTGAHQQKEGLFRYADGGTLFLDEIGDMPVQTQLSLLRVLQEQTVRPVGSHQEVPIDARVIAATNASLSHAVQNGTFREDLFYRLDVIRLEVPPLRERPEDILFLFNHFLKQVCADYEMDPPELDQSFIDLLVEQSWPGNVRQLENLTQRLALKGHTHELTAEDLNDVLYAQDIPGSSTTLSAPETTPADDPLETTNGHSLSIDPTQTISDFLHPRLTTLEKEYLESVLAKNNGRINDSANQAGMSRRTLHRKLKAYNIDKHQFRNKNSKSGL
ncbi:MAG: sigma-54 dependent transcriptional regulator [Nitrospirota bacterium]|nr:sigma-54 dependent transcriptional regulator [Nitrospirota bacterium]